MRTPIAELGSLICHSQSKTLFFLVKRTRSKTDRTIKYFSECRDLWYLSSGCRQITGMTEIEEKVQYTYIDREGQIFSLTRNGPYLRLSKDSRKKIIYVAGIDRFTDQVRSFAGCFDGILVSS